MNQHFVRLKQLLLDTHARSSRFCLVFRPGAIWFDERNPRYLMDLSRHNDLHIGDSVDIVNSILWATDTHLGETSWRYDYAAEAIHSKKAGLGNCVVAGFFKLQGNVRQTGLKLEETYCAIASDMLFEKFLTQHPWEMDSRMSIIRGGSELRAPIMLFWADGLKKIITEQPE